MACLLGLAGLVVSTLALGAAVSNPATAGIGLVLAGHYIAGASAAIACVK